jgi:hypothetical protein
VLARQVLWLSHASSLKVFFFLVGPGLQLRAVHLQSRHSARTTPPIDFALVIFEDS